MSNRNYNVFFNTHTVSGIVISVALYVIFFAGAFALFRDEIKVWENGKPISQIARENIDYDQIFSKLDKEYSLVGRDIQLNLGEKQDKITAFLAKSRDSLASYKAKKGVYTYIDIHTNEFSKYEQNYDLGEFLYRLHFFHQIPSIGIYLAGFISIFFLFAIVTGIIVHWKKIIPNFYQFNPKIALKRVWTDAHTALGVIGLPFQFIYAVTGAYFALSVLVLIPAVTLYGGDQSKLVEDLRPTRKTYKWIEKSEKPILNFNDFVKKAKNHWDNFHITRGFIKNYGGNDMKYIIMGEQDTKERFVGIGYLTYDAYSGEIEASKDPNQLAFIQDIQVLVGRLHFGELGGIPAKIIYFILAFITCFVIITGVLIWVEARNKKSKTIRQRLYTSKVGHIYLAICLSMLPVTALAFLFVRITNGMFLNTQTSIYTFYFITWLGGIIYFRFKRDNYYTNRICLLAGAILGFLIPIVNGITSGNWIWSTFINHQHDIFLVDILWLVLSSISLIFYTKISPEVQAQSSYANFPIDYKNAKTLLAKEKAQLLEATSTPIPKNLNEEKNQIEIPMKTKIVILWLFIALGWIIHHVYGLFGVYYNESLMIEGSDGTTPMTHHLFRMIFEGLAMLLGLLTIEVSKKWFVWVSFVWAILSGIFNVYHLITSALHDSSNISEILMLTLMVVTSSFLVKNLNEWRKNFS